MYTEDQIQQARAIIAEYVGEIALSLTDSQIAVILDVAANRY